METVLEFIIKPLIIVAIFPHPFALAIAKLIDYLDERKARNG